MALYSALIQNWITETQWEIKTSCLLQGHMRYFLSGFGLGDKVDLLILYSNSELTLTGVLDSVMVTAREQREYGLPQQAGGSLREGGRPEPPMHCSLSQTCISIIVFFEKSPWESKDRPEVSFSWISSRVTDEARRKIAVLALTHLHFLVENITLLPGGASWGLALS